MDRVARIDPPAPSPLVPSPFFHTSYTETRGDGPTRTFNYTSLHLGPPPKRRRAQFGIQRMIPPRSSFFLTIPIFKEPDSTHLGYDPNWYISSVRDAGIIPRPTCAAHPQTPILARKALGKFSKLPIPVAAHVDYTYYDEGPTYRDTTVHTVTTSVRR